MVAVNQVLHGDCLELMRDIPDKSIDLILCDLPYGLTACKWDVIIPFEPLWEQYKRIVKPNAAIVLTASQPFTSQLVMSNPEWFKYEWIWEKDNASNPALSKSQPLKYHENILIFCNQSPVYFPQMWNAGRISNRQGKRSSLGTPGQKIKSCLAQLATHLRYPKSILQFSKPKHNSISDRLIHPTQKPVALFEYLIKTYTNEGDLVLDNCAGSGTTAIAAINTNRNYILMEKELDYFNVINKRIADTLSQWQPTLFERVQWLETQVQAQSSQIKRLEQRQQLSLFG